MRLFFGLFMFFIEHFIFCPARAAAFLAAEEGVRIGMAHCLRAVALEYEKSGRPLTRAEFGAAYPRLRGGTGR